MGLSEKPAAAPGMIETTGGLQHLDLGKIHTLFKKYPNVKLCLSGHLHVIDRVDYFGVSYLSNPAVCGNWWKPTPHLDRFGEMYTTLDLFKDGTFDVQYVDYGWTPEPDPVKPTTAATMRV